MKKVHIRGTHNINALFVYYLPACQLYLVDLCQDCRDSHAFGANAGVIALPGAALNYTV